jgi:uncharacterized membrane protein YbhN (UPF0104 family)
VTVTTAPNIASDTTSDIAEPLPTTGGGSLLPWVRRVVIVAVVAYAAHQLALQWDEVADALVELSWPRLAVSTLAVTAGVLLSPLVWQSMLAALGVRVGVRDSSKIYLVGQLGKYVPGSVMAFLLQMELARSVGVSRARSFSASLLTAGIVVVASLLAGTLAIPAFVRNEPRLLWLFALLPIGLVMLHPTLLTAAVNTVLRVLRRDPLAHRLSGAAVARGTGLSVLTYALYGVHLFVLAGALRETWELNAGMVLLLCVGSMGLAMTAGLVAFILPSGIGARELVIVGGLTVVLPYGQALALAVVSRLLFTVVELATAGLATLVVRISRSRPQPA